MRDAAFVIAIGRRRPGLPGPRVGSELPPSPAVPAFDRHFFTGQETFTANRPGEHRAAKPTAWP